MSQSSLLFKNVLSPHVNNFLNAVILLIYKVCVQQQREFYAFAILQQNIKLSDLFYAWGGDQYGPKYVPIWSLSKLGMFK